MADLSQYSDEELMDMAGISNSQSDLSQFSDEELFQMAGLKQPESSFLGSIWEGVKAAPSAAVDMVASIPSGVSNIYESIFTPNKAIESGAAERVLRGTGALASGSAGSIAGGALGALGGPLLAPLTVPLGVAAGGAAGTSLYDLVNELFGNDAPTTRDVKIDKFGKNLGTGIALAGAGKVAGKAANTLAPKVTKAANALDRKSIGTYKSDYGRAGSTRVIETPEGNIESFVKDSLDDLLENNKLGNSRDPQTLLKLINEKQGNLGDLIEEKIANFDRTNNVPVVSDFPDAMEYLTSGKVPADRLPDYLSRLAKLQEGISREGQGKLAFNQQQKIAFGKSYDAGDEVLAGFNRAIYNDLKNTIESKIPEIETLNKELQPYQIAEPIIKRSLTTVENASLGDKAKAFAYTTGGVGLPILVGSQLGGPVGTLVGTGLGLLQNYVRSPKGQAQIARSLRNVSRFDDLVGTLLTPGVGLAQGTKANEDSNERRSKSSTKRQELRIADQNFQNGPETFLRPHNTPTNDSDYIASSLFSPAKAEFKSIEAEIDKNPYYSALYEAESGRNPKAKNPKSTATGGFQFIKATAKSLGLDDPKDLAKSYEAVQRFTDEHRQRFGDDPGLLYAAHFLGAPLLSKVISNKNLSDEEEQQVSELRTKAMPRFLKIFNRINQNQLEA